jgi:hypothetical protein
VGQNGVIPLDSTKDSMDDMSGQKTAITVKKTVVADPSKVCTRAKKRGFTQQRGTIGHGTSHYADVQVVDESVC